eukprot:scaffold41828_cov20-Phaeocystis_antarctica.AAC.1
MSYPRATPRPREGLVRPETPGRRPREGRRPCEFRPRRPPGLTHTLGITRVLYTRHTSQE